MKKGWHECARKKDIKNTNINYVSMQEWIKENVPEGTEDKNIKIEFEFNSRIWYYDETVIEADMILYYKYDGNLK
jgi:hypothetical protein